MICPRQMSARYFGANFARQLERTRHRPLVMTTPLLPKGICVLERGWLSANNILFTDGDQPVMIDSGYCTHSVQTVSLVEGVLGDQPLGILINTHLHSDHCGGNAALQARYPAVKTLIPPGQAALVSNWDPVALTYLPTGQLCPRFLFAETLLPGTCMAFGSAMWELHAAPGHDPHSLIFFEPVEKILISADALWENGFGVVFPELDGNEAFSEVAATFDLIERLNPQTVIPGHGSVFAYSPEILSRARQKLEAFESSPARHAHHAAKVLLKFKLLEVQQQPINKFVSWALATPYLMRIHEACSEDIPMTSWIDGLCEELLKARVAGRDDTNIFNM